MADTILGIQTRAFLALAAAVLIAAAGVVIGVMGLSRAGAAAARAEAVKGGVDQKIDSLKKDLDDAARDAAERADEKTDKKLDERFKKLDARIDTLRKAQENTGLVMKDDVETEVRKRAEAVSATLLLEVERRNNFARGEMIKALENLRTAIEGGQQGLERRVLKLEMK